MVPVLILALLTTAPSQAAETKSVPRHSVVYDNLLALRYNPLGLEDRLRVAYQLRLYDSDSILWKSAYVGVALTPTFNPALTRLGGRFEIMPIAILKLHAGAYFVAWHGTFEYFRSFPSALSDTSDEALDAGEDAGLNYATTGYQVELGGQFQIKFGPIAIRDTFDFYRSSNDLHNGDRAFYDPRLDLMIGNDGWHLENDLDVVWISNFGLVAGVRTHLSHAWYDESDFAPGESSTNPNSPYWTSGLLAAYVFDVDWGSAFQKPTVIFLANWYLKHRYRTGQETTQALPYLGLAFRINGDLWTSD